jgi:DNA-binding MarR family transcriptional regulator
MRAQAEATAIDGGLRPRHVIALTFLRQRDGQMSQQDLADALHLDRTNVVGLLNELEDRGLVMRERDRADRRRHFVKITPPGMRALERGEQQLGPIEDRVLAALTEQERETLHELLLRAVAGNNAAAAELAGVGDEDCLPGRQ